MVYSCINTKMHVIVSFGRLEECICAFEDVSSSVRANIMECLVVKIMECLSVPYSLLLGRLVLVLI